MPQAPGMASRIPATEWEAHKALITRLYVSEDKTLDEVKQYMKEHCGFVASKAQYIRKVNVNWKLRKYSTKEEWEHASSLVSKRKAEGKATQLMMNGKTVSHKKRKKEMRRYPTSQIQQTVSGQGLYYDLEQNIIPLHGLFTPSPSSSNDHSALDEFSSLLSSATRVQNMEDPAGPPEFRADELIPTRYGHDTRLQPHQPTWLTLFHSLVFLCTNSLLESSQATDQFLKLVLSGGYLEQLKQILITKMLTTDMFAVHLLFSSLTIESKESLELFHFLLQHGTSPNSVRLLDGIGGVRWTILQKAVAEGHQDAVALLVKLEADPNEFPDPSYSESPLNLALKKADSSSIAEILIHGGADVNYCPTGSPFVRLPLFQAIANKDHEGVRILLRAGADPNYIQPSQLTALHCAIDLGDLDMLNTLIQAGANPNSLCQTGNLLALMENRLNAKGNWHSSMKLASTPIQMAVQRGDYVAVERLMAAGATLDNLVEPDLYNDLVLPLSKRWRPQDISQILFQDDTVEFVLSEGADHRPRHRYLPSPLQTACGLKGHGEKQRIVEILLTKGADINALPAWYEGRTALQAAAEAGDYDLVEDLVRRGADINAPAATNKGLTVLQAAIKSGHRNVVDLLLGLLQQQRELKVTSAIWRDGTNYLETAISAGNVQLLDAILRSWSDAGRQCPDEHIVTVLSMAIKRGFTSLVQRLLDASPIIAFGGNACTILCEAIWERNDEIFGMLIDQFVGIDFNVTLPGNPTPLWVALHQNQEDMARRLIEAGADVDRYSPHVCPSNHLDSHKPARRLETPMKQAIRCSRDDGQIDDGARMVRMLVDAGANVNRLVDETSTPLRYAVVRGEYDIAKFLIHNGADPNAKFAGNVGFPIHAEDISFDMCVLLLDAGADVNTPPIWPTRLTALQRAVRDSDRELVDLLLAEGADINAPAFWRDGRTALQAAALHNNFELVKILVARGADINAEPAQESGATALQYAAINGHINMAIFLLDNGALIGAPACLVEGRTALEGAAEHGRLDMIHLLLENDEDPDTIEERCQDAAEFAENEHFPIISKLLREYKAP
ncbi:hypothetical protein FSARC_5156 [Fusarium sarcochroum]|uniref:Clr5 domain-containing protein n=1 Tax=Fusarium sarcochroum TaxID=1208366 RepID=A0A8H4U031_9HYPO|nr:hypothetical protein FSARC_5156 [Fusarium sarcochroum]